MKNGNTVRLGNLIKLNLEDSGQTHVINAYHHATGAPIGVIETKQDTAALGAASIISVKLDGRGRPESAVVLTENRSKLTLTGIRQLDADGIVAAAIRH